MEHCVFLQLWQNFEETFLLPILGYSDDGDNAFLQFLGIHLKYYAMPQHTRPKQGQTQTWNLSIYRPELKLPPCCTERLAKVTSLRLLNDYPPFTDSDNSLPYSYGPTGYRNVRFCIDGPQDLSAKVFLLCWHSCRRFGSIRTFAITLCYL